MGQYYKPVILNNKNKTTVEKYLYSWDYGNGLKLMEHSYIGNNFVGAFESQITENPQRVVWAGDYADHCKNRKSNVSDRCNSKNIAKPNEVNQDVFQRLHPFIVNHSKKEYVDKREVPNIDGCDFGIHPLPLLTCEGNGRGGGDFRGDNKLVGSWARDIISVEQDNMKNKAILLGYTKLSFDLVE
jgi:hypothetical protein